MALSDESSTGREARKKITVRNVSRSYGSTRALGKVSFSVAEGEFCCIVGPSGCGKTTLLRAIAGLDETMLARRRFLRVGYKLKMHALDSIP